MPPKISDIINRLNQELTEIEANATRGLNILRPLLEMFPNNDIMVQFYIYLNNSLFLVEIYQRRIQATVELLSVDNVGEEVVHEQGQDLGDLLGRAIESKIGVERIIRRLENLQ